MRFLRKESFSTYGTNSILGLSYYWSSTIVYFGKEEIKCCTIRPMLYAMVTTAKTSKLQNIPYYGASNVNPY